MVTALTVAREVLERVVDLKLEGVSPPKQKRLPRVEKRMMVFCAGWKALRRPLAGAKLNGKDR